MRTYEALVIFPETLKDDAVGTAVNRVRTEIDKLGGRVSAATVLGKRQFSRTLKKLEAGHYVRVTFDLEPDKLVALQARYRLIEQVFRVQIVRQEQPAPVAAPQAEPAVAAPAGAPATAGKEG